MTAPNILLTRIDNRLLHGQVGISWTAKLHPNLIIVADDEVANDEMQKQIMSMTAEMSGIGIRFFSIQKCADIIWKASEKQHIFLVVRNPHSARLLVEKGLPIRKLNVGNMHYQEGKRKTECEQVYVDDQDVEDFQYMKNHGVEISIQITPDQKEYKLF